MSNIYGGYSTPADPTVMDGLMHGFHFGIDPEMLTRTPPPLQRVHILPPLPDLPSDQGYDYSQPDSYAPMPNPSDYYSKVGSAPLPDPRRKAQGELWSALAGLILGGTTLGRVPGGAASAAAVAMTGYGQGRDQADASRQRLWQEQMQQARSEYNRALQNWQMSNAYRGTSP